MIHPQNIGLWEYKIHNNYTLNYISNLDWLNSGPLLPAFLTWTGKPGW